MRNEARRGGRPAGNDVAVWDGREFSDRCARGASAPPIIDDPAGRIHGAQHPIQLPRHPRSGLADSRGIQESVIRAAFRPVRQRTSMTPSHRPTAGPRASSGDSGVDQHSRRRIVRVPTLRFNAGYVSNREDCTGAPGGGPIHLASANLCKPKRALGNDVHQTRTTWCSDGTNIVPTLRRIKLHVSGILAGGPRVSSSKPAPEDRRTSGRLVAGAVSPPTRTSPMSSSRSSRTGLDIQTQRPSALATTATSRSSSMAPSPRTARRCRRAPRGTAWRLMDGCPRS